MERGTRQMMQSTESDKLGCCPACGVRLSAVQAGLKGRFFDCRGCGRALRKSNGPGYIASACGLIFFSAYQAFGFQSYLTWSVLAGGAVLSMLCTQHLSKINLA